MKKTTKSLLVALVVSAGAFGIFNTACAKPMAKPPAPTPTAPTPTAPTPTPSPTHSKPPAPNYNNN